MAADPKEKLELVHEQAVQEDAGEGRQVYLRDGRTLTVASEGSDELVEIRASSGMLELRIKLTEDGPVLQMESVRMALRATESLDLEAKHVNVKATEAIAIASAGKIEVTSEADTKIEAKGEVRVNGKMIWLN
jgi:hypothetical protein